MSYSLAANVPAVYQLNRKLNRTIVEQQSVVVLMIELFSSNYNGWANERFSVEDIPPDSQSVD